MSDAENHFTQLGLAPSVKLDRSVLDAQYFDHAAKWHPDRFVSASPAEKARAQLRAAQINEAYRILKNTRARAQYLVKLGGIDLDSSDPEHGAPAAAPAFLMQMLQLRESLDEGELDAEDALDEAQARIDAGLQDALDALEGGDTQGAARFLVELRYLQRWADELSEKFDLA